MEVGEFEILEKDLAGRIGRIKTAHGIIETPTIAPVINPIINPLTAEEILSMGFKLLITNAYIIMKHYGKLAEELKVHNILGVNTPIMTDSGAYQLMVYGDIDVDPDSILKYQESIGSDIGVILDIPTRYNTPFDQAKREVEETIKRAKRAIKVRKREDFLLVGPVQGGRHKELVEYAARTLSKIPMDIYAIGGPVQMLSGYKFEDLIDLIMTAKMNLPMGKPLHLFGAGHPMVLPLIVALGVDLFDSASYALYAKDNRYMTPWGTYRVETLEYFPCSCPTCSKYSPHDIKNMPKYEVERILAKHNLYTLLSEINSIKQSIREGRLWELMENRLYSHPALLRAFSRLKKYIQFIEKVHPKIPKSVRGVLFFDKKSLIRPEVIRHKQLLKSRYIVPRYKDIVVLVPDIDTRPHNRQGPIYNLYTIIRNVFGEDAHRIHMLLYSKVFGAIPLEISDTYPLSQYEESIEVDEQVIINIVDTLSTVFTRSKYHTAVVCRVDSYPSRLYTMIHDLCKRLGVSVYEVYLYDYEKCVQILKRLLHVKRA
ncbi:MAG: tRNA guanosine(15) transglycosylase TgtA [Thermoprotei archaeon]|nr:MAG: tRNA guanosine(15) transglycosylase TgtA [Thermoprotei archaeon]